MAEIAASGGSADLLGLGIGGDPTNQNGNGNALNGKWQKLEEVRIATFGSIQNSRLFVLSLK